MLDSVDCEVAPVNNETRVQEKRKKRVSILHVLAEVKELREALSRAFYEINVIQHKLSSSS